MIRDVKMRVISGQFKGRRLTSLPGQEIRPTIARLKESFFNIVQSRIRGSRFLDLCAGSGSMGIEALSREASEVVFLEQSRKAIGVLQKNLTQCRIKAGFKIVHGDLFKELPKMTTSDEPFDIIFFDPPYFQDLYETALELVSTTHILATDGILAADHFKKTTIPDRAGELIRTRMVRHGDAILSFYERASSPMDTTR